MSEIGQRTQVAVSWLGKVKTASQMLAITACLALPIELKLTHPGLWMLVFRCTFDVVVDGRIPKGSLAASASECW